MEIFLHAKCSFKKMDCSNQKGEHKSSPLIWEYVGGTTIFQFKAVASIVIRIYESGF